MIVAVNYSKEKFYLLPTLLVYQIKEEGILAFFIAIFQFEIALVWK